MNFLKLFYGCLTLARAQGSLGIDLIISLTAVIQLSLLIEVDRVISVAIGEPWT